MMSRRFLLAASALSITGALAFSGFGCGSDSSLGPSANAVSRVRAINALSGAPSNVTVVQTATNQALVTNSSLPFGSSTDYVNVRSGNGISLRAILSNSGQTLSPDTSLDLNPHDNGNSDNSGTYTVGVVGTVSQTNTGSPDYPQVFRVLDNFPNNVGANNIAIRLVNLSPDAGPVSLFNTSGGAALPIQGLTGVSFSRSSTINGSGYVTVPLTPSQTLNLSLRNSVGTVLPTTNSLSQAAAPDRSAITLFVVGSINPSSASGRQALNVIPKIDFTP